MAFDISHSQAMVRDQFMAVTWEMQRPAVLFRPSVYADGSQWCALYGDDIMSGVCGFGETPEGELGSMIIRLTPTATSPILASSTDGERNDNDLDT